MENISWQEGYGNIFWWWGSVNFFVVGSFNFYVYFILCIFFFQRYMLAYNLQSLLKMGYHYTVKHV